MTVPSSTASSKTLWCKVRRRVGSRVQVQCTGRDVCIILFLWSHRPVRVGVFPVPPAAAAAGGDPTGTGEGGSSIYGQPFK